LIEVADKLTDQQVLVTFGTVRASNSARHLDRPINLNAVLLTLDAAVGMPSAKPTASALMDRAPVRVAPPPVATKSAEPRATPAISPLAANMPTQRPLRVEPVVVPPTPARVMSAPAPMPPSSLAASPAPMPASAFASAPASVGVSRTPAARIPAPTAPATDENAYNEPVDSVRILVVDDSDVALKFIHNRLSAFGFTVDKCTSGEEALVRVSEGDYAFVFLDVMMEGLDGYQTCKAIKGRRYPGRKAPGVVMLTSRGGTIDKVRGTFAGCDAYLTKPLDEVKMLKVLLKHDPNLADSISTLATNGGANQARAENPRSPNPLAASYENLTNRMG
jgi:CheY-like chemotaxis protein